MRKSIYFLALAAISLSTACSNTQDEIFDQSAAERLEQYKKDYADVLTSDGGLWTMEYFANSTEPGYLFVMKFNTDGSVNVSANHKWIGNTYKEQTSLWDMIADNGPVLTFNSYNELFHIFSDPADILGENQPKDDNDDDIDETGFGHEGDYEFQVMEVYDDNNTIRLLGKKRSINIYMRRLDPSTDVKAYMDEYKEIETNLFTKDISYLILKNLDGENYVVNDAYTGILSIYPENGDPVDQVRSGNFIITKSGIRFMEPLEIVNAANEEKTIEEFVFVNNLSLQLVDNENAILNAGTVEEVFENNRKNWKIDLKSMTGDIKNAFDDFTEQLKSLYRYRSASVNEFFIDYDNASKSYVLRFYIRVGAKSYETDKFYISMASADDGMKFSVGDAFDVNSEKALNAYSEMKNILNLLNSSTYKFTTPSDCGPKSYVFDSGSGTFSMAVSSK